MVLMSEDVEIALSYWRRAKPEIRVNSNLFYEYITNKDELGEDAWKPTEQTRRLAQVIVRGLTQS